MGMAFKTGYQRQSQWNELQNYQSSNSDYIKYKPNKITSCSPIFGLESPPEFQSSRYFPIRIDELNQFDKVLDDIEIPEWKPLQSNYGIQHQQQPYHSNSNYFSHSKAYNNSHHQDVEINEWRGGGGHHNNNQRNYGGQKQSKFFPHIKIQGGSSRQFVDKVVEDDPVEINEWRGQESLPENYGAHNTNNHHHQGKMNILDDAQINFDEEISRQQQQFTNVPCKLIPEIPVADFEVGLIGLVGGPNLDAVITLDDKDLRLDCLVKLQLDVLNGTTGGIERNSVDGKLQIFLTKAYVTLIMFHDLRTGQKLFMGPLFCDLVETSYKACSEKKSISWEGLSAEKSEGDDATKPRKLKVNQFTVSFPKTRIYIHATNVFIECNHAAGRSKISKERFLTMTGRDESHIVKLSKEMVMLIE